MLKDHARASCDRLGTEKIDLYQVHWPNPVAPTGAMFTGLADLQREGVIGHAGVSNYSLARWKAAEAAMGGGVLLSNQVEFNLAQRKPEAELLPWAQANDRLIIAYSPLAQGAFSGRWSPENRPGGVRRAKALFTPENMRKAEPLVSVLRSIADAHGATPSQVHLAWLLRKPNVVVIPGASSVAQLEANAAAGDLELSADDDARLVEAAEAYRPTTGLAAVPDIARSLVRR
jgi:aryl-alcohol dehydrogenase-like predicted oxidoreductase